MTIEELVRDCKAGKAKAQEQLYKQYASRLLGVCRRYARTKEEAQDIFQEAMVKVFHSIAKLENAAALEAWMRKIVVFTAINYFQKNKKRYTEEIPYEAANENPQDIDNVMSKMSTQELLGLINALPDGYRMVFNMYVIEGYSHKEIADVLQCSEGTSKSQLFRAKAILKQMVEQRTLIKDEYRF